MIEQDVMPPKIDKTFVAAGAGAGKTRNLVEHIAKTFIDVKSKTGKPPRIVGTTFTRMAANEIKDRVAMYAHDSESEIDPLTKTELFNFAYSEALNITTIHGVCMQLLLKKGFLLGYSPDLKIVSKASLSFYQKKILFEVIQDEKKQDIFSHFKFSEMLSLFENIDHRRSDLGDLASVEDLNALYSIVIDEIKKTFLPMLNDLNEDDYKNIKTRPEEVVFFIKNLKLAFQEVFRTKNLSLLKTFLDSNVIPRQNMSAKENVDLTNLFADFKKELSELKKKILDEKIYLQIFDTSKYEQVIKINSELLKIYDLYAKKLKKLKQQKSLISMSEVEGLTFELLSKYKDECQDYITTWDYWYIDEYQDTSPLQNKIFNILLENKPYYKVGDPQQSIYLFRGAQASIFIEEMENAKRDPNIEFKFLRKNYRSHPNLMAGINELFQHITVKSENISESFESMETKSEVDSEKGKRLSLITVEPKEDEISFVIEKIRDLNISGVQMSEICILAHSRKILTKYEEELTNNLIPCLARFSGGFKDRPEIQGLICFLNVINNPNLDLMLIQLLRTQFFKVEDSTLKKWMDNYKKNKAWSLWQSLDEEKHEALDKIKYFKKIFLSYDYIEGLRSYLAQSKVMVSAYNSIDLARRNANLSKVYAYACQKSEISVYNLDSLITDLESGGVEELESEAIFSQSKDGVRLFTIHGSKGLEFKHVFLVGSAVDRRAKSVMPIESLPEKNIFLIPIKDHKSRVIVSTVIKYFSKEERIINEKKEARRVIYVAATRAEENLYIVGGVKRNKKSELMPGTESLYKVIDINSFVKLKFKHIDVELISKPIADDSQDESNYKFLEFNDCNNSRNIEDLNKKVFLRPNLTGLLAKKIQYLPLSVSQVVDAISNDQKNKETFLNEKLGPIKLNFTEVSRKRFESIDLNKIYSSELIKSKLHLEMFLKPFIGDVFHKSIELFSAGVSESELTTYISNYFSSGSELVVSLIKKISEIKNPNMSEVLSKAKSEWGFNAIFRNKILLSGQIDLWGFDKKGEIHIIDYKTGSSAHKNKAIVQVLIYRDVLQQLYQDKKIHTHLLYVSEGELITVDGSLF